MGARRLRAVNGLAGRILPAARRQRRGGRYRPNRPRRCGSGVVACVRVGLRRRRGVRRTQGALRRRSAAAVRLLRRRSWRGVCLRVRGPTSAARSARWPARIVAVERLLDQASDKLPHRHARVHVRKQPPELLQPLLALRVDGRLQLVAAVAERAHPVGRRRQFRVQVGQHLADLPGALAGRLVHQLLPPHRIQHQRRRLRLGGGHRYGRRRVCRRIGLCRRSRRCDRSGAGDRPAAPLPVERPLQLGGGAQRQRAVAQTLPRVRLIGAQPHGAYAPSGGRVAVAELAHRVVEQAGEASLQMQAARLDLGQVVDDGALQVPFVADQVAGLPQQLAVGECADGGGDGGPGGGGEVCGHHVVNILPVLRYTSSPRPGPAMNLRSARAEPGAVRPKGPVSLSEARRGWNVRWRATLHAQNPVKPPRHDFSTFLAPVRVPQCRAGRVQESRTVNLAAAEVAIDSSASSCCGTPSAATPGSTLSAAPISTRRSSWDVLHTNS